MAIEDTIVYFAKARKNVLFLLAGTKARRPSQSAGCRRYFGIHDSLSDDHNGVDTDAQPAFLLGYVPGHCSANGIEFDKSKPKDHITTMAAKCAGHRAINREIFPQGRTHIEWDDAAANPPAPTQLASRVTQSSFATHPVLKFPEGLSQAEVNEFFTKTWPENVALTDIGVYLARLTLGAACKTKFPATFDAQGLVRATRVPLGDPVLVRVHRGLTWIMTAGARTILCGHKLGQRGPWFTTNDRPPKVIYNNAYF